MKNLLRAFAYILVCIILFIIAFCFFEKYKFSQKLDRDELNLIVEKIKQSDNLPQKFYNEYEKYKPNSLKYTILESVSNETQCQSYIVANRIYPIVVKPHNSRIDFIFYILFLSREIEKNTTQVQCLNWRLEITDFLNNIKGITNASKIYFKKDISELSDKELKTLIMMTEKPSKYNPYRRNYR